MVCMHFTHRHGSEVVRGSSKLRVIQPGGKKAAAMCGVSNVAHRAVVDSDDDSSPTKVQNVTKVNGELRSDITRVSVVHKTLAAQPVAVKGRPTGGHPGTRGRPGRGEGADAAEG